MRSVATPSFRTALGRLPADVRRSAHLAYRQFSADPWHPSLQFKQVHPSQPIYSARVTRDYRVLGRRESEDLIRWFWIGTHGEYDRRLRQR